MALLKKLDAKRNDLAHPKGQASIDVSKEELKDIKTIFDAYGKYVDDMMTNTGVSIEVPRPPIV